MKEQKVQRLSSKAWSYEHAWLSGPKFDAIFIAGVLFIALLSGAIVAYDNDLFLPVLMLDLWLLGYHHVISTFTKLAGTAQDRSENRFFILYLPCIVVASVAALGLGIGLWLITTIYFFWQWYHYVRQAYGVATFYRRRAQHQSSENALISQAALWSIPITGLLYRCYQGWDEFLFQTLWTPDIPFFIVAISSAITIVLLIYWVYTRLIAFQQGTLAMGEFLFTLSHFTAFYVGYIHIDDINIGWLVANIWHNAQYILFVWLYNTKRFASSNNADAKTLVGWLSQNTPIRILLYFLVCLLATSVFYQSLMTTIKTMFSENAAMISAVNILVFQSLNFHHYVVDSFIWKVRKKKHQEVMQLRQAD
ncbi:hypothetical protein ACFO4O_08905 [Glaciecola siphonariae]|uniref:Transmembrane protein n=1 Tax=Glaciecola siphonariae TaxID=521012 RepID=A0ABV9LUT7_9ALTE